MEASTLQPTASLAPPRLGIGGPLLRFRSDEQLVALFRAGSEDAFRAIHDRYNKRLFAYARQMLPARQDAEDALQDVFVRAYSGLRTSDRDLALRAWLFRVAHNRCIDELRKPPPPSGEVLELVRSAHDPVAEVDLRESLRRLVEDIRRLPDQQRSALLMRELGGMSYVELASSLGISVGAVKSLLVRARIALAQAAEARDTACAVIREQLVEAHDRGVRPSANTRKHMRDCSSCKSFRRELRGVSRQLAATIPAAGPLGVLAKLAGFSGGGGAGGGAALVGGGGTTATAGGVVVGVNHVATLIAAAVATAGGAVEIQHTILPPQHHLGHHHAVVRATPQPAPRPAVTDTVYLTAAPASEATPSPAAPSRAMIIHAPAVAPVAGGAARPRRLRRKHARVVTPKPPATQSATQPTSVAGSSSTSVNSATVTGASPTNPGCPAGATSTNQTSSPPAAAPGSATASAGGSTTPSGAPSTSTSCAGSAPTPTASTTPAAGGPASAGSQDATATGSGPASATAGPATTSSSSNGTAGTAAS